MKMHHSYRDIGGINTSVYDEAPIAGSSWTLVMVHGGDPRSLANGLDWSSTWDPPSLHARLVAYDKPGQGRSYSSLMDESAMSAAAISSHLEYLVESLGGRVVLIGHSRGALPVADVALRRPDLVEGLVLISSNSLAPKSAVTPRDFYVRAYSNAPVVLDDSYIRREPAMNSYSQEHIDREFLEGRKEAGLSNGWWSDIERRSRIYEDVTSPTLDALQERVLEDIRTKGFEMPVSVLWGLDDVSAPLELGQNLFQLIAAKTNDSTFTVFNRSGHYVFREHGQQFLSLLRSFHERLVSQRINEVL